jgi:hypothetical protein
MILILEDPKDSTRKLLNLINEFSKVSESQQRKSIAFLYNKHGLTEKKVRKTSPSTMASKIYLGINPTEEVKDFYGENDKTQKKQIEEDARTMKNLPCSWIGSNIVKMAILPKVV